MDLAFGASWDSASQEGAGQEGGREACILNPGSVSPQPSRALMLQQAKL